VSTFGGGEGEDGIDCLGLSVFALIYFIYYLIIIVLAFFVLVKGSRIRRRKSFFGGGGWGAFCICRYLSFILLYFLYGFLMFGAFGGGGAEFGHLVEGEQNSEV